MPKPIPALRLVVTMTVAALALSACAWSGPNEHPLPFAAGNGDDAIVVTVHLANAVNLVPNSEVKVNDVTVGSVRRIRFDNWHARLTVGLDGNVRLPENATARIGQKSLLGAEYLELAPPTGEDPSGRLADGSVIGLSRTGRYPETEELFTALAAVLNGGGLNQVSTITTELNKALGGREGDVRQLVVSLGTLIGTLDAQRAKIISATEGINDLSKRFADDKQTLAEALETLPQAVDVLRDERTQLVQTLESLADFGDSTTTVLNANRKRLRSNLKSLRPILRQLGNAGDALTGFMASITFPFPLEGLIKSIKGDYLNLFLTVDISTTAITRDLLGGITPLESVYEGVTGSAATPTSANATDPLDLDDSLQKLDNLKPDVKMPDVKVPQVSVPDAADPGDSVSGLVNGLLGGLNGGGR